MSMLPLTATAMFMSPPRISIFWSIRALLFAVVAAAARTTDPESAVALGEEADPADVFTG
ncbi:hypothetical protein ACFY41_05565 [Streptomyces syringium]|uniref:hypothetical protein n=1 Tax=Streptomyces syringium TaxID=76729 RepID=UPI0036A61C8A